MDHNSINGISDLSNNGGLTAGGMAVDQTAASSYRSNNGAQMMGNKPSPGSRDRHPAAAAGEMLTGSDLRQAILGLMREMTKSKKQIHKEEVFSMLQGRAEREVFDSEMVCLQDDGDICQSFDQFHFCLVD